MASRVAFTSATCAAAMTPAASSIAATSAPTINPASAVKKPSPTKAPPVSAIASKSGCAQPCSMSKNARAVPGRRDSASAQALPGSKPDKAVAHRRFHQTGTVKRHDARQERAKVLIVADHQLADRAVLVLGHEKHVEQAQHTPPLQPIDFSQDPTLEVGTGTETHGNHLQRTRHLSTSLS